MARIRTSRIPLPEGSLYLVWRRSLSQQDPPHELSVTELGAVAVLCRVLGPLFTASVDAQDPITSVTRSRQCSAGRVELANGAASPPIEIRTVDRVFLSRGGRNVPPCEVNAGRPRRKYYGPNEGPVGDFVPWSSAT